MALLLAQHAPLRIINSRGKDSQSASTYRGPETARMSMVMRSWVDRSGPSPSDQDGEDGWMPSSSSTGSMGSVARQPGSL